MGPVVSILLDKMPSKEQWKDFHQSIKFISNKVDEFDFWVVDTSTIGGQVHMEEGRPFSFEFMSVEDDSEYAMEEIILIEKYSGVKVNYELTFYASSNQEIDHRILGELAYYLSNAWNGLIDFNGKLLFADLDSFENIWPIQYQLDEESTSIYHVAKSAFMKCWLQHSDFCMIK